MTAAATGPVTLTAGPAAAGRVGIDMVPLGRVRDLVRDEPMLARMLSPEEIRLCQGADGPDIQGIAGRLAAKEAVFKLFHASGQTLPWRGIEILSADGGWPVVRLAGRAAELARDAGIDHIAVSITHDDPCAVAVAFTACNPDNRSTHGSDSGH